MRALRLKVLVHCLNGQERWSIDEDISRLLSSDDTSTFHEASIQHNSFNGTYTANFTFSENTTSYWHLHADAPLLEQPSLDALQIPVSIKQSKDSKIKALEPPVTCSQFNFLSISPIFEFVIQLCGALILGSLSCTWIILVNRKRRKERIFTQRGAFSIKCRLVLGLNVHATVCAVLFLTLQTATHVVISFASLSPRFANNFCNVALSLLDICIAVFWIFVGISNTFLILFLRDLKPGANRTEPWAVLFKSHRNAVLIFLLAHCIPWVCGIALNTLQLVFLNETAGDLKAFHYRSKLLRALTTALPVAFSIITICIRLWKYQGHRLHLPSLSRIVPSYSCQQEYTAIRMSPNKSGKTAKFSAHTDGAGPICIALFSSNIVSTLHLICSFIATIAGCLQIMSISLSDRHILSKLQALLMHAAVGLFYALTFVGYSSRLTLASAITSRNSYNPGEMIHMQENYPLPSQSDDKLTPRELLEIPKFTRTQFFDTSSPEANHCVTTSKPVQFIAVYKPVVS
ncbi:hypothetical protein ACTXT7_001563 [Hymenolepis weldensis]